jgi:hypothetical protein
MDHQFWTQEDPHLPQNILDTIQDNDGFALLVENQCKSPWANNWSSIYLRTFWQSPSWEELLGKILSILCHEVQHDHLRDARPILVHNAASVRILIQLFHCH